MRSISGRTASAPAIQIIAPKVGSRPVGTPAAPDVGPDPPGVGSCDPPLAGGLPPHIDRSALKAMAIPQSAWPIGLGIGPFIIADSANRQSGGESARSRN